MTSGFWFLTHWMIVWGVPKWSKRRMPRGVSNTFRFIQIWKFDFSSVASHKRTASFLTHRVKGNWAGSHAFLWKMRCTWAKTCSCDEQSRRCNYVLFRKLKEKTTKEVLTNVIIEFYLAPLGWQDVGVWRILSFLPFECSLIFSIKSAIQDDLILSKVLQQCPYLIQTLFYESF